MLSLKPSMYEAGQAGRSRSTAISSKPAHMRRAQRLRGALRGCLPSALGSLLLAFAAAPAHAQDVAQGEDAAEPVDACLSAHVTGQELRRDNKLLESRELFRQCARPECPTEIARDCFDWLDQYQRQIPSISLRVTADGTSRADAQIFVDEQRVDPQRGKAVELNPGEHHLRVQLVPFEPFDTRLLVAEGDQFRIVDVTFTTPPKPMAQAPSPVQESRPEPSMHRPVPATTYVFAAVTAAAAVSGAGWGLSSWSLREELKKACAPGCRPESVDVLQQRATIADISWGVSAASLIAAVTFYVLRPERPVEEKPLEFGVNVLPSGAVGTVSIVGF